MNDDNISAVRFGVRSNFEQEQCCWPQEQIRYILSIFYVCEQLNTKINNTFLYKIIFKKFPAEKICTIMINYSETL